MTRLAGIDIDAPPTVVIPIFLVGLLGVAYLAARLVRRLATRLLRSAGAGTAGAKPTTVLPQLGLPVAAAVMAGGVLLILPEIALPGRLGRWLGDALTIAFVASCALTVSRIAVTTITEYGTHNPSIGPAMGVARGALRVTIAVLAAITALESVGVPVAPLLTTLGIGSLAVALALQDTLANFFAGLYLLADRPVGAGDYIKIHDGEEGYVETIGWRSSRLRTAKGSIVIVPNQRLSQAILTNFHRPTATVVMTINLTVAHGSDIPQVEGALSDELARAKRELPELAASNPLVRLVDTTEAGMVWSCIVEVPSFEAQFPLGHELRKRLLARLRNDHLTLGVPERLIKSEKS